MYCCIVPQYCCMMDGCVARFPSMFFFAVCCCTWCDIILVSSGCLETTGIAVNKRRSRRNKNKENAYSFLVLLL